MEKYSVLMSVYYKEKPKYLKESIDSMINQTIVPDEIVLVEDGPLTNELQEVLNSYEKKYPSLFNRVKIPINVGLGLALNEGLRVVRNDLVARMDTDDLSKPNRCEKQLKVFDSNPELSIVGAYVDEFYNSPDEIISTRVVLRNVVHLIILWLCIGRIKC